MDNVIERIAHFANIDTRRAMGFLPRKLHSVHFDFPEKIFNWGSVKIVFGRGIEVTKFYYTTKFNTYSWIFGCMGPPHEERGYVFDCVGKLQIVNGYYRQYSWHPDLNEDGSFKRSQIISELFLRR